MQVNGPLLNDASVGIAAVILTLILLFDEVVEDNPLGNSLFP